MEYSFKAIFANFRPISRNDPDFVRPGTYSGESAEEGCQIYFASLIFCYQKIKIDKYQERAGKPKGSKIVCIASSPETRTSTVVIELVTPHQTTPMQIQAKEPKQGQEASTTPASR
jgi:hypothetical protein